MEDKEAVYKERLSPLVKQLRDLAQELGIPFVAYIQVNDEDIMSSGHLPTWGSAKLHMVNILAEHGLSGLLERMITIESAESTKLND
jgi:hypothetical protein